MSNETESFKRAFFDLPSRQFGETYVQPILYEILGDEKYKYGNEVDALRNGKLKGEYKAVRVVFPPNSKTKNKNLFDDIMSKRSMSNRIGTLKDIYSGDIVANCQNIKMDEFDYLVYVLVDDYGYHIFEMTHAVFKRTTKNNSFPNWSPNHGREEHGRNGQFPIKGENLSWHMKYLKKKVSWAEIVKIAKRIKYKYQKNDL